MFLHYWCNRNPSMVLSDCLGLHTKLWRGSLLAERRNTACRVVLSIWNAGFNLLLEISVEIGFQGKHCLKNRLTLAIFHEFPNLWHVDVKSDGNIKFCRQILYFLRYKYPCIMLSYYEFWRDVSLHHLVILYLGTLRLASMLTLIVCK